MVVGSVVVGIEYENPFRCLRKKRPSLTVARKRCSPPRPPDFNVDVHGQRILTLMGVVYASANAFLKGTTNIEIGGRVGGVTHHLFEMGVFYANTGIK